MNEETSIHEEIQKISKATYKVKKSQPKKKKIFQKLKKLSEIRSEKKQAKLRSDILPPIKEISVIKKQENPIHRQRKAQNHYFNNLKEHISANNFPTSL